MSAGGVVDIPADDTACDGSWVVFLSKHDGAANQSLVSFEVLQESILREGCLTSPVSFEGNDLSVVVRRRHCVFPTVPDWLYGRVKIDQRVV